METSFSLSMRGLAMITAAFVPNFGCVSWHQTDDLPASILITLDGGSRFSAAYLLLATVRARRYQYSIWSTPLVRDRIYLVIWDDCREAV
jgi:hypothetical protein